MHSKSQSHLVSIPSHGFWSTRNISESLAGDMLAQCNRTGRARAQPWPWGALMMVAGVVFGGLLLPGLYFVVTRPRSAVGVDSQPIAAIAFGLATAAALVWGGWFLARRG